MGKKQKPSKGRLIGKEHWRTFFKGDYLGAWDIPDGPDTVVTIREAREMTITGRGGLSDVKPVLFFAEFEKGMVLNVGNSEVIEQLLGPPEIADWYGKKIRLYVGESRLSGERVPAIKVRGVKVLEGVEAEVKKLTEVVVEKLQAYEGEDKSKIAAALRKHRENRTLTVAVLEKAIKAMKDA